MLLKCVQTYDQMGHSNMGLTYSFLPCEFDHVSL